MINYTPKPKEWFLARISKRIYRDHHKCCPTCDDVAEKGIIVHDEFHARYLAMIDNDFAMEGAYMNYRDEI